MTTSTAPSSTYEPHKLLDLLLERLNLKNDAALARMLGIVPPVISKMRHGTKPIEADLLSKIQELSGIDANELLSIMGEPQVSPRLRHANNFVDAILEKLGLKTDIAFAKLLGVAPPVISKIRHGKMPIGPCMLIRIHEISDISIRDLRTLMGKPQSILKSKYKIQESLRADL